MRWPFRVPISTFRSVHNYFTQLVRDLISFDFLAVYRDMSIHVPNTILKIFVKILEISAVDYQLMFYILTKLNLDSSYTDPQLKISGFQYPPYRNDRSKYGDGKILFLRGDLIARS